MSRYYYRYFIFIKLWRNGLEQELRPFYCHPIVSPSGTQKVQREMHHITYFNQKPQNHQSHIPLPLFSKLVAMTSVKTFFSSSPDNCNGCLNGFLAPSFVLLQIHANKATASPQAPLRRLEKDALSSRYFTSLISLKEDPLPPSAGNAHNKYTVLQVHGVNDTPLNVRPCALYNLHNHTCGPSCKSELFKIQV